MSAAEERLANDPTSELWGEHRARYRFAAKSIRPDQIVLDVACGAGFGLEMLLETGTAAIGVDYDIQTLRSSHARCIQSDAARLPFADHTIDVVVSFETLEHVSDAAALVAEFRRVLKPDGQLILSTPNRAFRESSNPFHIREFTAGELETLLREHFSEVQLLGQRPDASYKYVPFLMLNSTYAPDALAWKGMLRLPFPIRNRIALVLTGRPFYPSETDYCFEPSSTDTAHALLAVAQ